MKDDFKKAVGLIRDKGNITLNDPKPFSSGEDSKKELLFALNSYAKDFKEEFEEWLLKQSKKRSPKQSFDKVFYCSIQAKPEELEFGSIKDSFLSFEELFEQKEMKALLELAEELNIGLSFQYNLGNFGNYVNVNKEYEEVRLSSFSSRLTLDLTEPFLKPKAKAVQGKAFSVPVKISP